MRERRSQTRPWRVAVVAPCAFPSARGSQVLIREVSEALAQAGHEVHVVTYPTGEHLVPIRGIAVHRTAGRWLTRLAWLPWLLYKAVLDVSMMRVLLRVVRDQRIDVIHAHNYEGPLMAFAVRWFTGVPIVYHAHNALSDELPSYVTGRLPRWLASVVGRFLDRQVPRRADHVIALTGQLQEFLRSAGVAADAMSVVPPVAPAPIHDDGQAVAGSEMFDGRFVILYAGNLDGYQDLDVLAHSIALARQEVPDTLLVIATHDPQWQQTMDPELVAAVAEKHAAVVVAPSFNAVRRLLARAQVLVCPRSSWSGYPIKLLNYLAAGRPIVVAQGSAKEIMSSNGALVVPNRDARALANAFLRLRRTPTLTTSLAAAAHASLNQGPTWGDVVSKIEQIYARVCGRVGAARPGRLAESRYARELIEISRDRISGGFKDGAAKSVRSHMFTKIAIALFCIANVVGCAHHGAHDASLPPLDAPLPAPPGQAGPYRMQPGDLLRVKFMYHPELDVKVPIRPDGGITLQVGGNIRAAGLTTEELEKVIVERTSDRLREPEVSVLVAQTADLKVYVMGEVRLPGIVPFREGITPLQAIADRGGFNDTARVDSVLRLSPSEDEYQGTRLDFSEPLEVGSPEGVQLRAGDVLYVPRTFIGDVNSFVRLYIRGLLPIEPRIGAGTTF